MSWWRSAFKEVNDWVLLDLAKPKKESNYQESYAKISSEYKFYLSFENSLCQEYITEKFFNAMDNGMIPIAFGGLTQTDYSKIAPPHSYIHVDDYESSEKLIEFLEIIKQNETLYQSYFWWKDYYSLKTKILAEENQCYLCQILNQEPSFKSKNDYSDFTSHWNKCRSWIKGPIIYFLDGRSLARHKQNETLCQSYFWWMDYYSLKTKNGWRKQMLLMLDSKSITKF